MFVSDLKLYLLIICYLSISCQAQMYTGFLTIDFSPVHRMNKVSEWVEETADFAVTQLSKDKKKELKLQEVAKESVQFGAGVLYSTVLEVSGRQVSFDFIEPRNIRTFQQTALPSGNESNTVDVLFNELKFPQMDHLELNGPLNLYFQRPRDDVTMRLPNIVEAGSVSKIIVDNGVSVNATGLNSIRLVNPVEIELDMRGEDAKLSWKQIPRIELNGDHLSLVSNDRTKVKRKGENQLEFISGNTVDPKKPFTSMTLPLDHQLFRNLEYILGQSKAISDKPHKSLARIIAGNAEAVTLVQLPMVLSESGVHSLWNVLVTINAAGHRKVVSSQEIEALPRITVSESLILNGTLEEIIQTFSNVENSQSIMIM